MHNKGSGAPVTNCCNWRQVKQSLVSKIVELEGVQATIHQMALELQKGKDQTFIRQDYDRALDVWAIDMPKIHLYEEFVSKGKVPNFKAYKVAQDGLNHMLAG